MTRTKPLSILGLVAVPLVALAVAGCGGSSNSSSNTPAPTIPKAAGGGAATVGVSNTSLGTVHLFQGDHAPGDTNGQGITAFVAVWYGVNSAGNQVTAQPSSGTTRGY
jgi:hypothetical protein